MRHVRLCADAVCTGPTHRALHGVAQSAQYIHRIVQMDPVNQPSVLPVRCRAL